MKKISNMYGPLQGTNFCLELNANFLTKGTWLYLCQFLLHFANRMITVRKC